MELGAQINITFRSPQVGADSALPKLFCAELTRAEHRLPLAEPLVLNFYLKCVPLHTKAISSVP